jgi:hypothetical protein
MIRRDVLKSMGAAAAGGAGGVTLAQAEAAQAQEAETPVSLGFGPYGTPWTRPIRTFPAGRMSCPSPKTTSSPAGSRARPSS